MTDGSEGETQKGLEAAAPAADDAAAEWLGALAADLHDPERVRAGIGAAARAMAGEGLNLFEAMRACGCLAEACRAAMGMRAEALRPRG